MRQIARVVIKMNSCQSDDYTVSIVDARKMKSVVYAVLFAFPVFLQTSAFGADRTIQLEIQEQGNNTNVIIAGEETYSKVLDAVLALRADRSKSDEEVLSFIEAGRNTLPPPYYLEATRRTCQTDISTALDWQFLFSLRARYDAMRCTDPSAAGSVQATLLWLQMPECASYMSVERELLNSSLLRVSQQPDLFQSEASPWWICSSGMSLIVQELEKAVAAGDDAELPVSTISDEDWLLPEAEWAAVQQKLREAITASLQK